MFDQISDRFNSLIRDLRGLGKITDKNINDTSREIRRILLEADVNINVTREFVNKVKNRSLGTKVTKSIKPGEQFIKIIHDELINLFGQELNPQTYSICKSDFLITDEEPDHIKLGSTLTNDQHSEENRKFDYMITNCLLYTSPSPRDLSTSRMPSSA